jgi:putative two-component system response regulator
LPVEGRLVTDSSPQQILVVDDNRSVARLLQTMLVAKGHPVQLAHDGLEAMSRIAECPPELILLDLDMPNMGGYEVCKLVKENPATRFIPIIIITGQSALENKLHAWELGADDFLTKPFQPVEVIARCRSLLRVKRLVDELESAQAIMFAFARTLDAKSPYTQGHSERVAQYAVALATEVGVAEATREVLRKGALLHDIGKISVPDVILNKPKGLTPEEYDIVKQHTVQGARIIEPLRSLRDQVPLVRWHHERLDGRGYPDGLRGEAIPLLVRILSVADIYDSLASARPYREAIPHDRCVEMLRSNAEGGGLDTDLVEVFHRVLASGLAGPHEPGASPPTAAHSVLELAL